MKYKVGDKVRIKSKEWYEKNKNERGYVDLEDGFVFWENMRGILGLTCKIKCVDKYAECYKMYETDYSVSEDMIEGLVSDEKPLIPTELVKDIANVIKTHNLGVYISENEGKLIIEPLKVEEEFKPLESGIYRNKEDGGVSVVFGGRIHVAVGTFKPNAYCIGLQELNGIYECGEHIEEEWMKNRPTVNLVINNTNSIRILRDALDIVENKLNNK